MDVGTSDLDGGASGVMEGTIQINVPAVLEENFQRMGLQGNWMSDKNVNSTAGRGHSLTINVEMDLGKLLLVSK